MFLDTFFLSLHQMIFFFDAEELFSFVKKKVALVGWRSPVKRASLETHLSFFFLQKEKRKLGAPKKKEK